MSIPLKAQAVSCWSSTRINISGGCQTDPKTGVSPSATTDDLLNGDCTSCEIAQDKSAYWSPQMYFYDSDEDSYEAVPEVQGHITYYKNVPATLSNGSEIGPIAVPNGMKMVSVSTESSSRRTKQLNV